MPTEQELITIDSYNRLASPWNNVHQATDVFDEAFPKLQRYLPKGGVLEIGSAGLRDGEKIKAAGYDYIAMDITPGFVEIAGTLHPNIRVIEGDICNPPHFGVSFDGIWCAATLIHLPKAKVNIALTNIHSLLRPGGIGYISLKMGEGDMIFEEEELDGQPFRRYTTFYQQDEFTGILDRTGFRVLESYQQPVSEKTTWLNYFIQK